MLNFLLCLVYFSIQVKPSKLFYYLKLFFKIRVKLKCYSFRSDRPKTIPSTGRLSDQVFYFEIADQFKGAALIFRDPSRSDNSH